MPKNIVVCCDGTANQFAADNTNVVKLFSTLVLDPATQVAYYHPGLGTREPQGALATFTRKLTKLAGMVLGYGLAEDIHDAYAFLMRMNLYRRRRMRPGALVHESVFERGDEYRKRLPPDAVVVARRPARGVQWTKEPS